MSTSASSTNGSRLNSRLTQVLWLWWSVSNSSTPASTISAVIRAVYCVGEADRVLGAVVSSPRDGVVLVVDRRGGDLARPRARRVYRSSESFSGASDPSVSARKHEEGGDRAATTIDDDSAAALLGHDDSESRDGGRASLVAPGALFQAGRARLRPLRSPAYSAMYGRLR